MADLDFWELAGLVRDQYPGLLPFLSKPGVFQVLSQAIQENWPEHRLQATLEGTEYYQNTPLEARQWDVLQATDPATARQRTEDAKRKVDDAIHQLGLNLTFDQYMHVVGGAVVGDWDVNRVRYELLSTFSPPTGAFPNGQQQWGSELAAVAAEVKGLGDQWGVPVSDESAMGTAREVIGGRQTIEGVRGSFQQLASLLFPALKPHIDSGVSVADFAAPYMQLAVQELGINPNEIRLSDPKWTGLFLAQDDKGQQTVRSMQDAVKTIRTDASFGYNSSPVAIQKAAGFAERLGQMFGVRST